jgi:hypothetical protein
MPARIAWVGAQLAATLLAAAAVSSAQPKMADHPQYRDGWRMAGANPQRTSWVPNAPENQTKIPGQLKLEWYKPFEPFIWQKVQLIARIKGGLKGSGAYIDESEGCG